MIDCGCCDGEHATVAEIRACCADNEGALSAAGDAPVPPDEFFADDGGDLGFDEAGGSFDTILEPTAAPDAAVALLAPVELGRSLVVGPGQDVPDRWAEAPRFTVDPADLTAAVPVIDVLHGLWATRQPYVVEMAAEGDRLLDETDDREPWRLDPTFAFPGERLAHLVRSNAVDLRHPEHPTFAPLTAALTAGGRPGAVTDVVDRDGNDLWCDGGPLDARLATSLPLVPAVGLDHHRLRPLVDRPPSCELATDQLAAVRHPGGPCRVISPAGSGKTRTLTERARHLLGDWQLPPAAVCLVAYNKRAAEEMAERLPDLAGLQIRTLNALALAIVNGTGPFGDPHAPRRRVTTIDEGQVRRIIDELVDLPRRANTDPTALWIEALAKIRLGLRDPDDVAADYGGDLDELSSVFVRYQDELSRRGAVDFDQQVYGAITVLLRDPAARRRAQQACALLLVDEFQDLTPAHLLLLRLLAAPRYDVFGVGDDDQTIYGYNGADPRWLIDFEGFFPGAASHPLTVNYRCPPVVVEAADNLLSHNRHRVAKQIHAPEGADTEPGALTIEAATETVTTTVSVVRDRLAAGATPDEIVVLTRVNSSLAPAQVALAVAGIPVDRVSGTEWLQRTGVRAALAWLTLAARPDRLGSTSLKEAARRPGRGISRMVGTWIAEQRTVRDLRGLAGRMKQDRDRDKITAFADDVEAIGRLGSRGAAAVLTHVRDEIGLGTAVNTLDTSRNWTNRASHGDDLDALIQLASLHDDIDTFAAWLADRLAEPAERGARVRLHTVHRVKGLEWPHVVVHEASARLFPHHLSSDREEERRIFHVALTRGSASVTVVAPTGSMSPFAAELNEKVELADLPPEEPEPAPTSRTAPGGGPLEEQLRTWRREKARARDVPAYVVFTDKTLDDLLERRPTTLAELGGCHGIGPAKLEGFGPELLAVITGREPTSGTEHDAPPDHPEPAASFPVNRTAPADLTDRLKAWRLEQARRQDVPAYRIFSNKTLEELSVRVPTTDQELIACSGIGPAKLESFGPDLLALIIETIDGDPSAPPSP